MMKRTPSLLLSLLMISTVSFGAIDLYEFKTPEQETRYKALIEELRCPKCQNQNLAGSDAPIAVDLKNQTYQMIVDGKSDREIRDYMFERYGDFISYKPPMRPSTWILWIFPPILLIVLVLGWLYKVKKGRVIASDEVSVLSSDEEAQIAKLLAKHTQSSNDNKDKP